jgi:hypothetical protein
MKATPSTLAQVYKVYKLVDTIKNLAFFVLIEEYIQNKPVDLFWKYDDILIRLIDTDIHTYIAPKNRDKFNYDEEIEKTKAILTVNPEANINEQDRKNVYNFLVAILNIKRELLQYGIKSRDYVEEFKNLGYDYRGKILRKVTSAELWGNPLQTSMIGQIESLMTYILEQVKMIKKMFSIAYEKDSINLS